MSSPSPPSSSSASSPPTHDSIQSLLRSSAYNPAIIPTLESYVRAQLSAASTSLVDNSQARYSFDANRTLVKLYQFFPERQDGEVVAMVAFLALMNWPEVEMGCLGCLVSEGVMGAEVCATLVRCTELLESCRFSSFWPEFRKLGIPEYGSTTSAVSDDRKLLADAVNGLKCPNTIRSNIISMLSRVYKSAPVSHVLEALDIKDEASLLTFASKIIVGNTSGDKVTTSIVEKVKDGFVVFASCPENTKRVGSAFKEGVSYGDVARMMYESKIRGQ